MDQSQRKLLRITQIGFFFSNSCNFECLFSRTPALCASIFHTPKYCFLQRIEDDLKNNPKLLSTDPLETILKDTATCIRKQDDVQLASQLELGIIVTHSCHKDLPSSQDYVQIAKTPKF